MDLGIENRVALVMGGGGGLGRAIAVALAAEGCAVAVADRDAAALAETARLLGPKRQLAIRWDLKDLDSIDEHVRHVESTLGGVDILVNITGGPAPSAAAGQSPTTWREQFEAMILSVIAITDRVLPGMRSRHWGRVLTSTSSGVVSPIPNLGLSNSLRSSLLGWSKTLAREVAADGITANIIVPGRIATARIRFLDEAKAKRENRSVEVVATESTASIPMGRYGDPSEYANVVTFLASERASYVTGSIVRVDGGLITSI
jgi:3-oxoacyl-[acyl-carrier protein] reductase